MPDGGPVRLRNFVGAPFVLYFYPKDDTSGCTREAQEFSARLDAFKEAGGALLGVSKDKPTKHQKFIEKYGLTVPLASDEDGVALAAFGTWVEKRSEEHTSELPSLMRISYAVFCLKKKKTSNQKK